MTTIYDTVEGKRLLTLRTKEGHWNRWGPFLAERAWATVREDYSADGDAWGFFPHDHARSRAYRWNEDGLAGICDRHQYLCFALALWNEQDAILKERLFGVTGPEGNHGEDVKEYYYYLDSTPTHSWMHYRYQYPQRAYPYEELVQVNQGRSREEREYELCDTGIFDDSRYFEVDVLYAKQEAEHLLVRIQVTNRGPEEASLHVLPTLWFRNTWRWGRDDRKPSLAARDKTSVRATHFELGEYVMVAPGADQWLFTENETNNKRLFDSPNDTPYVKDAFHEYVVNGNHRAVNPAGKGTRVAAHHKLTLGPGETGQVDVQLYEASHKPLTRIQSGLDARRQEADAFYQQALPEKLDDASRLVVRQAFAGMLWTKQYYHYVITDWLEGDPGMPAPPAERKQGRNHEWTHLFTRDVISMPDKWEFPWFASWDLAFHCITLAHVDPDLAKEQIILMLREWYMHPNGQIPAYEWDFGAVNPPVLPLAARSVFEIERATTGEADYNFIERVFHKMLLNFTWWVNRKDAEGKNIFQGGFLGMDNIGPFDRGDLPAGYQIGQADGTSWMAAFAKSMLYNAMLLAERDPNYEDLASKFWEHFVYIANALNGTNGDSLWDEEDGFFYDHLSSDKHGRFPVRARTMVGFTPLFGASTVAASCFDRFPHFDRRRQWFIEHRPYLTRNVDSLVHKGTDDTLLIGLVRPDQLKRMLAYMLDEDEFLSDYGIRSVSKYHEQHPLELRLDGKTYHLDYEPGESTSPMFGGNSNWRGPIWLPVNVLILYSLRQYYNYYGDSLQVEFPTGSGRKLNLAQVSDQIALRLTRLFLPDRHGGRPIHGEHPLFQRPEWRDLLPFHEYFHGDTGRGCGAYHQTGWSGMIASIMLDLASEKELLGDNSPRKARFRNRSQNGTKPRAGKV